MRQFIAITALIALSTKAEAMPHGNPSIAMDISFDQRLHIHPYGFGTQYANSVFVDGEEVASSVVQDMRPIAIAIVYSGWTFWVGRDELEADSLVHDPVRAPGALAEIKRALARQEFHRGWPVDSQCVVLAATSDVDFKLYRHRISAPNEQWIGDQWQFAHELDTLLFQSIDVAISQVIAAETPRRAIIVLGDGKDNRLSHLSPDYLRKRLASSSVELFSIIWHPGGREPRDEDILAIAPDSIHVATANEIEGALSRVIEDLRHRGELVVETPLLPWDGGVHTLELRHGSETVAAMLLWLPGPIRQESAGIAQVIAWVIAFGAAGSAALAGVLFAWRRRRAVAAVGP